MCLDVINQTWSPMFGTCSPTCVMWRSVYTRTLDMFNIFETFLPQLLRYPNPNDPLNGEAAALLNRHVDEYNAKVKGASLSLASANLSLNLTGMFRVRAAVCYQGGSWRDREERR